jgi:hypothetical protein
MAKQGLIARLRDRFLAPTEIENPNVTSKFDLLVIEAPYYSKPINGRDDMTQYAFIVARRSNSFSPWKIERQKYDRTTYTDSISESNFVHGPDSVAMSDGEVLHAFAEFELACLAEGMEKHVRTESSYTFGLPAQQALKFLDISKRAPAPKAPTAA